MNVSPIQQKDAIDNLMERATHALENENKLGAAYLACVAGMWANRFNMSYRIDTMHAFLAEWFRSGYEAFTQAAQATIKIRKAQADKEAGKKVGKHTFLGVKLW